MMRIAMWSFLVVSAAADFEKDLAFWFYSYQGLNMNRQKADEVAHREAKYLEECGITIAKLQDLRNTLYGVVFPGWDQAVKTAEAILPLAYKQVDASAMATLMRSVRRAAAAEPSYLETQRAEDVIVMAKHHVDLLQYEKVSNKVKNYRSSDIIRHEFARDMVLAGADVAQFSDTYYSPFDAWRAVNHYLNGRPRRYAKDCKLYHSDDFQGFFEKTWLQEWLAAPEEMRTAPDGKNYYAWEFKEFFGDGWMGKWDVAPTAVQYRINSADRKEYPLAEFCSYFGEADWQTAWQAGGIKSLHGNTQNQAVLV